MRGAFVVCIPAARRGSARAASGRSPAAPAPPPSFSAVWSRRCGRAAGVSHRRHLWRSDDTAASLRGGEHVGESAPSDSADGEQPQRDGEKTLSLPPPLPPPAAAAAGGLFSRSRASMTHEEFCRWRQEVRARSRSIPLVADCEPLELLYEDEHLIAVSKPSGITTHPAHRFLGGTLLNRLVGYLGYAPLPVHRLDQATSGVVVMAKRKGAAVRALAEAFQRKQLCKSYIALVQPPRAALSSGGSAAEVLQRVPMAPASTRVRAAIARHPVEMYRRKVGVEGDEEVRDADTEVSTLSVSSSAALLRVVPHTGRTHQIRVHLEHIGFPIVGDDLYNVAQARDGTGSQSGARLLLHAWRLQLHHPITEQELCITAPPPADFVDAATAHNVDLAPLAGT